MMKESFPFFQRFSLIFEEGVFIIEKSGNILGMIKGKIFTTKNSKKIGVIAWLMIEPKSQSKAYAGPLMKNLMAYFEQSECHEVLACAHHINTSSSSGMSYFGFKPISFHEQLHSYGYEIFKVWKKAFHVFDYGHLLWRKSYSEPNKVARKDRFAYHLILNGMVLLLLGFLTTPSGFMFLSCGSVYLILRHGIHFAMLKASGLKELRYQGWESGYLMSILISCLTGFWLPCPGLMVKTTDRWRLRQLERPMLRGSLIFIGLILVGFFILSKSYPSVALFFLKVLWLELTLCFFPFQALLGAWVFRKNKWLWGCIWTIISASLGITLFSEI